MVAPIVVIGATGKTGEALSARLSAEGHSLFLIARDGAALAPLADRFGARSAVADATDMDALADAVGQADEGDGIAGLAYCAGSIVMKSLRQASAEDFQDCFTLNALGAAMAMKAAQSGLKKAKGAVVLFSTVAVAQGFANHTVIAAAKGALEGIMRSAAAELAPDVRVNAVALSLSDTKMAEPVLANDTVKDAIARMHALQRLGTAEDAAAAATFLLTDRAGWITGQVLGVDGGRSRLRPKG